MTEPRAVITDFAYVDSLVAQLARAQERIAALEARVWGLESALTAIANADYRGNDLWEHQLARRALEGRTE